MKRINIIIGIVIFLTIGFSSCESYLERKEDDSMTFEKIWKNRVSILQYLNNVYGYILRDDDIEDGHPFIGASDDAILSYSRNYRYINLGTWNPSNVPYLSKMWPQFYKGIREATIFIMNVDSSSADNVTPDEIKRWKAEARFARAYQYFLLFRTYGPFIIAGDEAIDIDITQDNIQMARSPLDECVAFIEKELLMCADVLPEKFSTSEKFDYGRPTKGACLALIGRLKLYAARPLLNGSSLYVNVKNHDGTNLFPTTPDPNKWKIAADANKALITFSESNNIYQLYKDGTNPHKSYQGVFTTDWNNELIFARFGNRYEIQVLLTPAVVGGTAYGGCGPTQGQVDAYAMSNGKYPITGYNAGGTPIIDPASGYVENGESNFVHPLDNIGGAAAPTRNMYINREPRFYASVLWSGGLWPYVAGNKRPVFAYNGNSGPGPRHDHPKSGYMTRKFVNPAANTGGGGTWSNITFPVIRLAEIYLNYVEALNECDPSNADIHTYLNMVRQRAGVPDIQTAYPEVAVLGQSSQAKIRELIRKERQVELFFECHRYFDTRHWMIADKVNSGPVYGMNVMAIAKNPNVTPDNFWKRTVVEERIFKPSYYLYPLSESATTRNRLLVQNYGW